MSYPSTFPTRFRVFLPRVWWVLDGCLDGCQAVIDTNFIPRWKAYFATAVLCNGVLPLLPRSQQILVDLAMILKIRIPSFPISK